MTWKAQNLQTPLDEAQRKAELAQLLDYEGYKKRREHAESIAQEWTTDHFNKLRHLAKTNVFFLAYSILGYTKLSEGLHGDVSNWMDATSADPFRLLMLPRGTYKTTVYTISHSIQCALTDDTGNATWPYCLGPSVRVCLIHEIRETAAKMLSEVQNHFLSNTALMALFPECIPDPKRHTINMAQLRLPRKTFWKEETFEIMGVGARSQGNHYNILKPDDLIGKEAAKSKTVMQDAKDWVDNIQSFLTSFAAGDKIDFTGTRWAHDDLYYHIMERYGDQIQVYTRAIEEKDPKTGEMVPLFPEEYPLERLEILRKNEEIFSAQYLNDPENAGSKLNYHNLKRYYWRSRESLAAFDGTSETPTTVYTSELDKLILIDPAMVGKIGITVTGTDRKMRIFVLSAQKIQQKPTDFLDTVFKLVMLWRPRAVVIENVLFSGLYEPLFHQAMLLRRQSFRVIMHKVPRRVDKEQRITASLGDIVESGQMYINDQQKELYNEFKRIGFSDDVHMVDSLAQGPHYWRPWYPEFGDFAGNIREVVERDGTTGYTPMGY